MKTTTIYQIQITTSKRLTRKLCFINAPAKTDVAEALGAEIDALNTQLQEDLDDDDDGYRADQINNEIAELEHFTEVVTNARWAARNEWVKGTLPVSVAGTRIGEISVEEIKAFK